MKRRSGSSRLETCRFSSKFSVISTSVLLNPTSSQFARMDAPGYSSSSYSSVCTTAISMTPRKSVSILCPLSSRLEDELSCSFKLSLEPSGKSSSDVNFSCTLPALLIFEKRTSGCRPLVAKRLVVSSLCLTIRSRSESTPLVSLFPSGT